MKSFSFEKLIFCGKYHEGDIVMFKVFSFGKLMVSPLSTSSFLLSLIKMAKEQKGIKLRNNIYSLKNGAFVISS